MIRVTTPSEVIILAREVQAGKTRSYVEAARILADYIVRDAELELAKADDNLTETDPELEEDKERIALISAALLSISPSCRLALISAALLSISPSCRLLAYPDGGEDEDAKKKFHLYVESPFAADGQFPFFIFIGVAEVQTP